MSNQKSVPEQWHIRTLTYRMADAAVIVVGWLLACQKFGNEATQTPPLLLAGSILTFHFVGEITGMYRNWRGGAS